MAEVIDYGTEEIKAERFVYRINKGQISRQFPRVLVSFAARSIVGNVSNINKEEDSRFGDVSSNHCPDDKEEDTVAIISGSDTEENHHQDGIDTKQVAIVRRTQEEETGPLVISADTNDKFMTASGEARASEEDTVAKSEPSTSKRRPISRRTTSADAAIQSALDMREMTESIITRSKSPACPSFSKKRKSISSITSAHNKNKKNKLKDEPTKIIKLHTGTLYLYRGLNPRAVFKQRR